MHSQRAQYFLDINKKVFKPLNSAPKPILREKFEAKNQNFDFKRIGHEAIEAFPDLKNQILL